MPRKLAFCHVLGWLPSKEVRAAHLVPKSLDEISVAHLFGAGAVTIDDPRNSEFITLILLPVFDQW